MAIASPSPYSASVALEIMKAGGNLIDQAIAVELALAVTHPYYAALGGGGFAVIRTQPKGSDEFETTVLDFREVAPLKTSRDLFKGKDAEAASTGGLAVAVPGVPAGLWAMHVQFGKLKWKRLFGPALKLAKEGFPVSGEWARLTKAEMKNFNSAGKKLFSPRERGSTQPSLRPGDIHRQPELAKALELFRDRGAQGFYQGPVAQDLVESIRASGGVLTAEDLKSYTPVWRKPLTKEWRGFRLHLMPLPSSGGLIVAQGLELYDRLINLFPKTVPRSAGDLHFIAESLKLAFASRGSLGDPTSDEARFEIESKLLDAKRLDRLASLVCPQSHGSEKTKCVSKDGSNATLKVETLKTLDFVDPLSQDEGHPLNPESTETTHFSIADKDGNAVAFTVTLNGSYGSGVVTHRFGIALNDEMDDFAARPGQPNQYGLVQGEANAIRPGRRPLSSMSPTIIEKGNSLFAVLGAPGGPRIASAVFQGALRLMAHNANPEEAVQWPRVHHQFLPDQLFLEQSRTAPELIDSMKSMGHQVSDKDSWVAKLYAIKMEPDGLLKAAADPRGEGYSGGQ